MELFAKARNICGHFLLLSKDDCLISTDYQPLCYVYFPFKVVGSQIARNTFHTNTFTNKC